VKIHASTIFSPNDQRTLDIPRVAPRPKIDPVIVWVVDVGTPNHAASVRRCDSSSSLKAIEKAEAFGLKVAGVIAIIDRMEGGKDAFAEKGYELRTLLTIQDLGVESST